MSVVLAPEPGIPVMLLQLAQTHGRVPEARVGVGAGIEVVRKVHDVQVLLPRLEQVGYKFVGLFEL